MQVYKLAAYIESNFSDTLTQGLGLRAAVAFIKTETGSEFSADYSLWGTATSAAPNVPAR